MAKEKTATRLSMNDLIQESKIKEQVVPMNNADDTTFKFGFDDEFDNRLKKYNEIINEHPDHIKNLKKVNSLLCRFYVLPLPRTKGGLIKVNQAPVQVQTKSGIGYKYVDDPYNWSVKAVVVKVPEFLKEDYAEGDIIFTKTTAVKREVREEALTVGNGFVHPDFGDIHDYPLDPLDPHYGYMWVDTRDILCVA